GARSGLTTWKSAANIRPSGAREGGRPLHFLVRPHLNRGVCAEPVNDLLSLLPRLASYDDLSQRRDIRNQDRGLSPLLTYCQGHRMTAPEEPAQPFGVNIFGWCQLNDDEE